MFLHEFDGFVLFKTFARRIYIRSLVLWLVMDSFDGIDDMWDNFGGLSEYFLVMRNGFLQVSCSMDDSGYLVLY